MILQLDVKAERGTEPQSESDTVQCNSNSTQLPMKTWNGLMSQTGIPYHHSSVPRNTAEFSRKNLLEPILTLLQKSSKQFIISKGDLKSPLKTGIKSNFSANFFLNSCIKKRNSCIYLPYICLIYYQKKFCIMKSLQQNKTHTFKLHVSINVLKYPHVY